MKQEPRPAIHVEKQLTWACKLGGISGDLQGGPNSVSQVDGVSDMAPACGSVGEEFRKGTMASSCLDVRDFSFSQYAAGAFHAATLVLELRGSLSR